MKSRYLPTYNLIFIDESSDSSGDNVENLPSKQFTITLSTEEWKQIEPNEIL